MADDGPDDDLTFWAFVLAGVGLAVYFARNMGAAAAEASGPVFAGTAPGTGFTGFMAPIMDILAPMQVSPAGAAMIAGFEGFSAYPYQDARGQAIGYGHTLAPGDGLNPPLSQSEGLTLLAADLVPVASRINSLVTVPLSQSQFDALASLVYNIGEGAFARSTLLSDLNAGDYGAAGGQFADWNQSQGRVNSGLVARREQEQQVFYS